MTETKQKNNFVSNIDTIAAIATPPGKGGVAIVRTSGKNSLLIAKTILNKPLQPRKAVFTNFLDNTKNVIDKGLAIYFNNPKSFTGEDIVEYHCHGGTQIVDSLLHEIISSGARLAKPGEFSERAFLNGKIDLVQAEAIADLIDSESKQAAKSAMRSLQGDFSKKINALVENIIALRSYIEAAIDFTDEEIDFLKSFEVEKKIKNLILDVKKILASAKQGSLLRDGITAVIAGRPNVGKSSLLNKLSGKDLAIVTDIAGTTRDILREHILIDGMPMHIIDTAGLRDSQDTVEKIGIDRAKTEIKNANLILFLKDLADNKNDVLENHLDEIPEDAKIIYIYNKLDLFKDEKQLKNSTAIFISAKYGDGVESLKKLIKKSVGLNDFSEGTFSARRRHIDSLKRSLEFLNSSIYNFTEDMGSELVAEDLRLAQIVLSEITGEFTSDDLLGKIFSSFCIGK